jgi:hypothetical protein
VSWSGNPVFSIKEIPRDSCSSTGFGTHRYSGDDSQSGRVTQANTYSDRTRSQGAGSESGEGSLERRLSRALCVEARKCSQEFWAQLLTGASNGGRVQRIPASRAPIADGPSRCY